MSFFVMYVSFTADFVFLCTFECQISNNFLEEMFFCNGAHDSNSS